MGYTARLPRSDQARANDYRQLYAMAIGSSADCGVELVRERTTRESSGVPSLLR